MFLHNLDYVNGKTMTHWRLSEGNLDIIEGHKDHYKNLQSTIDYYKLKINDMKKEFGTEMFTQSQKKFTSETGQDGKKCKSHEQSIKTFTDLQGGYISLMAETWVRSFPST